MSENIYAQRLARLREVMNREGMDSLIIPTADYHGSEYVAACFRLREHYSGFTGSAGTLLVRAGKAFSAGAGVSDGENGSGSAAESHGGEALLWTDGRYFIQAERELEGSGIRLMRMGQPGVPTLREYLQENMPAGSVLGFDGRCISKGEGEALRQMLRVRGIRVSTTKDLAGETWEDRPALPSHPVYRLDEAQYAGETAVSKLRRLRDRMKRMGATAYVSGKLDEIMWLYNIRGNDIECNPVALSYTIVTQKRALLYLQEPEITDDLRSYADGLPLELRPYGNFFPEMEEMRLDAGEDSTKVWYDPDAASYAIYDSLRRSLIGEVEPENEMQQIYVDTLIDRHLIETESPLDAMKAVRNETEIRNTKSCYLEDSAILTKFIYWLKRSVAAGETVTEGSAAARLDGMRAGIRDFVELSFPTISAYGSNAAMMHYEPEGDGAFLRPEGMYLVDSGGQYLRGTTDVTRTIALGPVTEEMKRDYTLTAVSQLQMMDTVFLKGCCGMALDIMAREPMWRNGMDYKCGTGHGIGYLLNVHEGPQSLRYRRRSRADETPFAPGMIISDEPGVYKEGKHGIRIETILLCREWGTTPDGTFLCFEPLTFVPLDPALIDPSVLTPDTRTSLNRYHTAVYEKLSPFMDGEERAWLAEQCAQI